MITSSVVVITSLSTMPELRLAREGISVLSTIPLLRLGCNSNFLLLWFPKKFLLFALEFFRFNSFCRNLGILKGIYHKCVLHL